MMNETPAPTEPESSGNLLLTVIVVLAVLIVAVIGIFWTISIRQAQNITEDISAESVTATATTSTSATTAADAGEYVFFDSDTREIAKGELQTLSEWQLKIARNEIYARHGRQFEHQDLQCYFNSQPWYKIDDSFTESDLSAIENANIATILAYEQEIDSSYLNYDSGCSSL